MQNDNNNNNSNNNNNNNDDVGAVDDSKIYDKYRDK